MTSFKANLSDRKSDCPTHVSMTCIQIKPASCFAWRKPFMVTFSWRRSMNGWVVDSETLCYRSQMKVEKPRGRAEEVTFTDMTTEFIEHLVLEFIHPCVSSLVHPVLFCYLHCDKLQIAAWPVLCLDLVSPLVILDTFACFWILFFLIKETLNLLLCFPVLHVSPFFCSVQRFWENTKLYRQILLKMHTIRFTMNKIMSYLIF